MTTTEVDSLDRMILRELYADVRASYKGIGDKLGVSHNTIKARIDRMLANGVFQFAIITSPDKVGREATAYLLIKAEPGQLEEIAHTLAERREVAYLGFGIGEADILALAHFYSNKSLFAFVNSFVGMLPGVTDVRTVLMCETIKMLSGGHPILLEQEETTRIHGVTGEAVVSSIA